MNQFDHYDVNSYFTQLIILNVGNTLLNQKSVKMWRKKSRKKTTKILKYTRRLIYLLPHTHTHTHTPSISIYFYPIWCNIFKYNLSFLWCCDFIISTHQHHFSTTRRCRHRRQQMRTYMILKFVMVISWHHHGIIRIDANMYLCIMYSIYLYWCVECECVVTR